MGDQQYHMIMNGAVGIGGFRAAMPGMQPHWMPYLSVADVDAGVAAAQEAGASVLMPPTDFPPAGRGATLADPQGSAFSIWKGADGDREDLDPVPDGDWYWNELMTEDPQAALKFYQGVFGFAHDTMLMGPDFTYYMLKKDGVLRGGLMKSPDARMPAAWLPYIRVTDCDACAAKAKRLGAGIMREPTDIPNVGRFAVFVDPLGAGLGIIKGMR
jgi:predicted enzyme related to lactoylglutathione lyase